MSTVINTSDADRAAYRARCTRRRRGHLIEVLAEDGEHWQVVFNGRDAIGLRDGQGINAAKKENRGKGGYAE